MSRKLNDQLVAVIKNELQLRDTAELLEIWQLNNRDEWTAEAFEAIRILLMERLGAVPLQAESASAPLAIDIRVRQHLDRARAFEKQGKFDQALAECDEVTRLAPRLASAHNYRGLLLDADGRLLEAIQAYRKAVRLDPQLTEASENLREAEREWSEQAPADRAPDEPAEAVDEGLEDDSITTSVDLPANIYLSDVSLFLRGWPGYRTRPGRSGYDPLDTSYEEAHVEGVLIRQMLTGTLRTRSVIGLVFLGFVGLLAELPLILGGMEVSSGHPTALGAIVILSVFWAPGLFLLWNVTLNIGEMLTGKLNAA